MNLITKSDGELTHTFLQKKEPITLLVLFYFF